MIRTNKNEKRLISFLVAAIVASGGYFLYLSSAVMPVSRGYRTDLGYVKPQGEDVRIRGEEESNWVSITQDANVFNKDRIFTGQSSAAIVELKSRDKITVESNSLIVISDHSEANLINLLQGTFFGAFKGGTRLFLKKGHSIFGATASNLGTSIRVEAISETEIKIVVFSGQITLQNQTAPNSPPLVVSSNEVAVLGDLAPLKKTPLEMVLSEPAEHKINSKVPEAKPGPLRARGPKQIDRKPSSNENKAQTFTAEEPSLKKIAAPTSKKKQSLTVNLGYGFYRFDAEALSNQSKASVFSEGIPSLETNWNFHFQPHWKTQVSLGVTKSSANGNESQTLDAFDSTLTSAAVGIAYLQDFSEASIFIKQHEEVFIRSPSFGRATIEQQPQTSYGFNLILFLFNLTSYSADLNLGMMQNLASKASSYDIRSTPTYLTGVRLHKRLDEKSRLQFSIQYKSQQRNTSVTNGEYKQFDSFLGIEFE